MLLRGILKNINWGNVLNKSSVNTSYPLSGGGVLDNTLSLSLLFDNADFGIDGSNQLYLLDTAITTIGDLNYLKLDCSNGPLTGELVITPASGTTALSANQDIKLLAGKKLIFDGGE